MNKLTKFICFLMVACITGFVIYTNGAQAGVRFLSDTDEGGFFQSNEQAFSCPTTFNKTCVAPSVGSGVSCGGKYESCACPADFKYQIAADCPYTGQVPDTSSAVCGGKYKACSCPSDYNSTCSTGNMSPKPTAIACGGKYKQSDCQCPADWFVASSCNETGKELGGTVCNSPDGVKYFSTCSCGPSYLQCENGGDTGALTCKNSYESFARYSKCKVNELDCAGEIKALFPTAKVITSSENLPVDPISGKLAVSGEIKSDGTLTLRDGAEIVSAGALSPKCQAGTLDIGRVYAGYVADPATAFTATVNIPVTIRNLNVEKNATFTINKDLTLETVTLPFGKTFAAEAPGTAKTILTKALKVEGNFTASNVDAKEAVTASGGTFIFKKGGTFAKAVGTSAGTKSGGNLTFMDGTFNLYQLTLSSNSSYNSSSKYVTPGYSSRATLTNATLNILPGTSSYATGLTINSVSTGGIYMTNSKILLNNSAFNVSASNYLHGDFNVSLTGGSVIEGISKFYYNSAYGFKFLFPAGAGASKVVMQNNSTLKPKNSGTKAYLRLVHSNDYKPYNGYTGKPSDSYRASVQYGVSGTVTSFDGSLICEKDAYCNNLSGRTTDTCEYPFASQPSYVYMTYQYSSSGTTYYSGQQMSCQSCSRNGKTYYGGKCSLSYSWGDYGGCENFISSMGYNCDSTMNSSGSCSNSYNSCYINGSSYSSGSYYSPGTCTRFYTKNSAYGGDHYEFKSLVGACGAAVPFCTEDFSKTSTETLTNYYSYYDMGFDDNLTDGSTWCLTAKEITDRKNAFEYWGGYY